MSVLPPLDESEGIVKQLSLFDDARRRSPAETLRAIRAAFLRELATGRTVDAGEGQQRDPYPPGIRNAVGPMIAALRRNGVITPAGADYASRPTRRRTIARTWRGIEPEKCRRLAEADEAWLAKRSKDAGESAATDAPAVDSTTNPTFTGEANDGQVK